MWVGLRKETNTLWKFTDGSTHDYDPGAHTSDGLGEPCFRIRDNPLIPVDVFCDRPAYSYPCLSEPTTGPNRFYFVPYLSFPEVFSLKSLNSVTNFMYKMVVRTYNLLCKTPRCFPGANKNGQGREPLN